MSVAISFDEIRFPEKIEFGVTGGPTFFTSIVVTSGGQEQRIQNWSEARHQFQSTHGLKNQTELDELLGFYYARRGPAIGFRFRNWLDFASDMVGQFGTPQGDAASNTLAPDGQMTHQVVEGSMSVAISDYQVIKTYATAVGSDYVHPVTKIATSGTPGPADSSAALRAYVNDVLLTEATEYTVDSTTGIITMIAAFSGGDVLSADYLYDIPVRFGKDVTQFTKQAFDLNNWNGIELVEVRV